MAVKLNLLPQDYAVSDSVAMVLKIVRPLNVVLLGLFLVTSLSVAAYFLFSSITIKELNSTNNALTTQVQSLSSAQQQIVLLKDRLAKVRKALNSPNAAKNLSLSQSVLATLTENSTISELTIEPQKSLITLNFKSNSELKVFMDELSSRPDFSGISMDAFGYNPDNGYVVSFALIPKNN